MVQSRKKKWRTTMEMPIERLAVAHRRAVSDKTVKLIGKLRWLGLEEDAQKLEEELGQLCGRR